MYDAVYEKCKICGERGYSCCKTQPMMNEEEIARIYYEKGELITSNVTVQKVGDNAYIYAPKNIIRKGKIHIEEEYCVFYDKKEHKCKIYDIRPKVCRDFGEVEELPCPFSNLTLSDLVRMPSDELAKLVSNANSISKSRVVGYILKRTDFVSRPLYSVPKMNGKYLKIMKEYMLLSIVTYYLNEIIKKDPKRFNVYHSYRLGLIDNDKISAVRLDRVEAKVPEFGIVAKLHNFLYNKIMTLPPEFIEVVVNKVNRIINGVSQKECNFEEDDNILYYLMAVALFKKYLTEYKNKSKQFVGQIKHKELFDFIKHVAEVTNSKTNSSFIFTGVVNCVLENADMLYRAIIKNK